MPKGIYIRKPFTEEHKKNISNGSKGRKHTEESKIKIGLAQKGKIVSEKTRKILSIKLSGKNHPNYGKKRSNKIKNKIRNSMLGVYHTEERKKNQSLSHIGQIPWNKGKCKLKEEFDEFRKYQLLVRSETKKWVEFLFNNFDGNCYYTKQKLITNEEYKILNPDKPLQTNLLQPTIDHKISIYYGFKNNIPYEEIGNINNLCICGRQYNSKKNLKNEN